MTQWLLAREAVGLTNEGSFDRPFIPRFDIDGTPMQQEVSGDRSFFEACTERGEQETQ